MDNSSLRYWTIVVLARVEAFRPVRYLYCSTAATVCCLSVCLSAPQLFVSQSLSVERLTVKSQEASTISKLEYFYTPKGYLTFPLLIPGRPISQKRRQHIKCPRDSVNM